MLNKPFSTEVFVRTGFPRTQNMLSDRVFYLHIGLWVLWGLLTTAAAANYALMNPVQWNWILFVVVGLVIPITGIFVAQSENRFVSILGYHMITIPFGFVLSLTLAHFKHPGVVYNAVAITALVTGIMTFASFISPKSFSGLGGMLGIALFGLIIARVFQIFIPGLQHLGIIDWISAGVFSLYIAYDMSKAQETERTPREAFLVALSVYLDIINLFINLLSILGDGDD